MYKTYNRLVNSLSFSEELYKLQRELNRKLIPPNRSRGFPSFIPWASRSNFKTSDLHSGSLFNRYKLFGFRFPCVQATVVEKAYGSGLPRPNHRYAPEYGPTSDSFDERGGEKPFQPPTPIGIALRFFPVLPG